MLKMLFGKRPDGFLANDGGWYTSQQYIQAQSAVRQYLTEREWTVEEIVVLKTVGSLSVIASKEGYGRSGFSFYMRDLVWGIVREDGSDDYSDAVRAAGIV